MAGPTVDNDTPFVAELFFAMDEKGSDLAVVLAQATYDIIDPGTLELGPRQAPLKVAGEWHGEPGTSSVRLEPQIAPVKPATDVVLLGHAYPARPGIGQVDVGLMVGPLQKIVRVFGDRVWLKAMGELASAPKPFAKIPLIYENAFGGWDRRPDPVRQRVERRNPVGVGFRSGPLEEGLRLPNLEDPRHLIRSSVDRPPPAGFGFIGPDWLPRARYAGTYDEAWMARKMPLLPDDFDRRFYNAAHPDLVVPGYLRGDERVVVLNASPMGRLDFRLPGLMPPRVELECGSGSVQRLESRLDTVIVDTDENKVLLLWRAHGEIRRGIHDLRRARVGSPAAESNRDAPGAGMPLRAEKTGV